MGMAPTVHEVNGRYDKAWKLAKVLLKQGLSHEVVALWDDEQWEMAADMAGVKPPSPKTQGLTTGFMTPRYES